MIAQTNPRTPHPEAASRVGQYRGAGQSTPKTAHPECEAILAERIEGQTSQYRFNGSSIRRKPRGYSE